MCCTRYKLPSSQALASEKRKNDGIRALNTREEWGNKIRICHYLNLSVIEAGTFWVYNWPWLILHQSYCFGLRWSLVSFVANPLNPKIRIWILICCPYSFHTEVVGRNWYNIKQFILCDYVRNSHDYCLTKQWYYKEKLDVDHSKGLKG